MTDYCYKILDVNENGMIIIINFKLEGDLYAQVKIKTIDYKDLQNIEITEGEFVIIDSDYSFKHIDVIIIHGSDINEQIDIEEWCDMPGFVNIKDNYMDYISNVVYECIIGAVSTIL